MKKVVKLSMIALAATLVVGCATNSDIDNLQSQIDGLKTRFLKLLLMLLAHKLRLLMQLQKLLMQNKLLTVLLNMLKTPTANWTACSKNQ